MFVENPEFFPRVFYKLDSLQKIEEFWTELQGTFHFSYEFIRPLTK